MSHGKEKEVPDEVFIEDAHKIVERTIETGIILRVIGAVAVRIHSQEFVELHKNLGRLGEDQQNFSDIDFMAYSTQSKLIKNYFRKELDFIPNRGINTLFGHQRLIFYHPKQWYHSDIFFNALRFSHDIFFGKNPEKGRLKLDNPTIPLSDIVLEKTQIHKINAKDIKDLIVLFRAHELGETDEREVINVNRITKILAKDWGFWYDVTRNLKKVKTLSEEYLKDGKMESNDYEDVTKKIDTLLEYIKEEPKTKEWKKRAKIGTDKQWWRVVEDVVR
ncbi:MAG: hypothetical protein GWO20_15105 [Candidatus Korarchaeota archaeon]|nr:hypothetical protein [Candidatus Korarchaeota archaeon]NIU83745.1 hypothetical protein [Candidatus Thorarchaeota archaeon]NIW15698.1 hypothetical protein [Candidatus Thorarchaeota archaeon]NIW52062.1 hypothetical protein [Candidatus Korarchaeota archaeon]